VTVLKSHRWLAHAVAAQGLRQEDHRALSNWLIVAAEEKLKREREREERGE